MSNELVLSGDNGLEVRDFDCGSVLNARNEFVTAYAPGFTISPEDSFNAVQSPMYSVNDCIGEVINLCGLIVHPVDVVDNNTGEVVSVPRIILIDNEGKSYASVSKTLFSSLKNLFAMYRTPDQWPENGLPIKIKQTSKGNKRYFGIEIVKAVSAKRK